MKYVYLFLGSINALYFKDARVQAKVKFSLVLGDFSASMWILVLA